MKNLTLENITKAVNGQLVLPTGYTFEKEKEILGAVTDNRQIQKDFLFIPMVGAKVDGHSFINDAFEKGAMVCFSEKPIDNPAGPIIMVESSGIALKQLATYYRMQLSIPIVGVIGSVGKTSTKEMLYCVLSEKYNVLKTEGNFNNEIGLPLTILRINSQHQCAVVEMGISEFGEMDRLGDIAKPDVVVMTNIGQAHLENLKTRDGILKAKSEVFAHMKEGSIAVLNADDDKLAIADTGVAKKLFYGLSNGQYKASNLTFSVESVTADFDLPLGSFTATIPLPGEHSVKNALAASAVAWHLGLDLQQIKNGMEHAATISGRNNIIHVNGITIIDDCYNASPDSMKQGLKTLSFAPGRKIAVLGDMGELGADEEALHYEVGLSVAENSIDILFTCGPLSKQIAKAASDNNKDIKIVSFDTKEEENQLTTAIKEQLKPGDTVLIKASHFMNFAAVVKEITKPL